MAVVRAVLLFVALVCFFLLGAPAQWLVARLAPRAAHFIPLLFCRSLLRLVGVRLDVVGDRVRRGPVLLVANHVSWIDILALGAVTPFCFLAKSEVGRWPILSAFAEVQGTVFVDRKRRRSIPGANRTMAERLREGRPVLLFPEGTTQGDVEPARFHSSHLAAARDYLDGATTAARVDVQPVALHYSTAAAAWIGDDALVPHLWRMLRTRALGCTVTFCEPIAFLPGTDRKVVAREARAAVAAVLKRRRLASDAVAAGEPDLAPATIPTA